MIIYNKDSMPIERRSPPTNRGTNYYAAVPADLLDQESSIIDQLIGYAFDTLGAVRLDLRVYDRTATHAPAEVGISTLDQAAQRCTAGHMH